MHYYLFFKKTYWMRQVLRSTSYHEEIQDWETPGHLPSGTHLSWDINPGVPALKSIGFLYLMKPIPATESQLWACHQQAQIGLKCLFTSFSLIMWGPEGNPSCLLPGLKPALGAWQMWKRRKFILCVHFFYNLPPTSADHSFSGFPASLYTVARGPVITQVRSPHYSALHLQGALYLRAKASIF